ncbi:MAG: hypothetical protein K2P99_00435, partial [Burkholderiales bacterium]|nr:hypothetical protein [Burkholderiales bacterium]
ENRFDQEQTRLIRSQSEKKAYFTNHRITKREGFELHHIIPLGWSENTYHFKVLDTWKNMVYIDAYSHAKITQNRNRNVQLITDGENIQLCDYHDHVVHLIKNQNIDYNLIHQLLMKEYNNELLQTVAVVD